MLSLRLQFSMLIMPQLAYNLYLGQDCFMSSAEWSQIFMKYPANTEEDAMRLALIRNLCLWPNVARGVRQYRQTNDLTKFAETLGTLIALRLGLYKISSKIQALLDLGNDVRASVSLRGDQLVRSVLCYGNSDLARLVATHAGSSLIVERMVSVLGAQEFVYASCASEMSDSAINTGPGQIDIQSLCMRVWMTYEHAWSVRPIGSQFMLVPLISSYLFAGPAMQNWIINALNEMDEHRMLTNHRHNHASVSWLARLYTGEDEPMFIP